MGSKFFNPIGSNSTVGRWIGQDSFNNSGFGKKFNSVTGATLGDPSGGATSAYAANHSMAGEYVPQYAGVKPNLADANNEYLGAAIQAGQQAGQNRQGPVQPIAAPTRQPMTPRMWS